MNQLKVIQGTTQGKEQDKVDKALNSDCPFHLDLLPYLKVTTKPVYLVVLDFAGLSTNYEDVYDFIR